MSDIPCCDTAGPIAPRQNKCPSKTAEDTAFVLIVAPDRWRFIYMLSFWGMVIFAIAMTNIFVKPRLAAGPPDGSTCPPFERTRPNLGDGGVYPGKGFDMATQNHLIDGFGFSNICANWDYSPSRELTAMVYPVFEYTLIIYLVTAFVADWLSNARGELTPWIWTLSKILFPINMFLCSQFRMIFVVLSYENVRAHTAGFLGLELSFLLVAWQNTLVIWDSKVGYSFFDFLGGGESKRVRNTRNGALVYIIAQTIVTVVKMYFGGRLVFQGYISPVLFREVLFGITFGQMQDWMWMILNAILPLFIAYKRSKADHPLKIVITQNVKYYDESGENSRLLQ